eukprot:scaffold221635_cov14-Prasinocladus_malaysianus.AAC.2
MACLIRPMVVILDDLGSIVSWTMGPYAQQRIVPPKVTLRCLTEDLSLSADEMNLQRTGDAWEKSV